MTQIHPITEKLISCRSILIGGHTNEHIQPCLEEIIADLDSITIGSTRSIIAHCVAEAANQVKDGDFVSAGLILNLIHNLPLDGASEQRWDIDYFISIELPTFLEHFEEIKSARLITLFVCKQLARQYMSDGG